MIRRKFSNEMWKELVLLMDNNMLDKYKCTRTTMSLLEYNYAVMTEILFLV
jgi:hypothetical protein